MIQHIELRHLRLFLGVVAYGSFKECADRFALSPPALSRTIAQLEDVLGVRLFDRTTRSVQLSPAGEQLRPLAERLLRDLNSGLENFRSFVSGDRGRVTIAALPSLTTLLLPRAIAAFGSVHPGVQFHILDALSDQVLRALVDGRADIGLSTRPDDSVAVEYSELVIDPFGLVCRVDDPLATGATHSWSIFTQRPFIAMAQESGVRATTDAAFVQLTQPVKPLYECGQLPTAGALIAAGLGVSALPRLAMPLLAVSGLVWRPLEEPVLSRSIGLLRPTGRSLSPAAEQFAASIQQWI